jgi:hypothetical protein
MKPLVLLDLDRTLFDTDTFYHDFNEWILKGDSLNNYITCVDGNDLYRYTDFEQILLNTNFTPDIVYKTIKSKSKSKNYLFNDATKFLINMHEHKANYDFAILSFGQERFQKIKIKLCPLLLAIDPIIKLAPKKITISNYFNNRTGLLIDDKKGQGLPRGWLEVHIDRTNYLKSPESKNNCIEISSLEQLETLLDNKIML